MICNLDPQQKVSSMLLAKKHFRAVVLSTQLSHDAEDPKYSQNPQESATDRNAGTQDAIHLR